MTAPQRPGLGVGTFTAILFGCAALTLAVALVVVVTLYVRARRQAAEQEAELASAHEALKARAHPDSPKPAEPELPTVTRHVPNHPLRLLEGCSQQNLTTITDVLGNAIEEGAPLYNAGDFLGCYRAYVSASMDLEEKLPKSCAGPTRALADGRTNANHLERTSAQAWAMRDAIDGLLYVIARSEQGGGL